MMKTSSIFIGLIIITSCDPYDNRLEIVNRMEEAIAVHTYSDTIPTAAETNGTGYYLDNVIVPGETRNLIQIGSRNGWPFAIARSKNKKLNLVVFNIDSLRQHQNIDSLISKGIYRSYQFTEADLNNVNWKVVLE